MYQEFETITDKPALGGWIDGGEVSYDSELCITKKLDCSATCCMMYYCAPHMGLCLNY